jgi:hypothetical protein
MGDSPGDSPANSQDPALSTRVTTGGLCAPVTRWKAKCLLLWTDRSQHPVPHSTSWHQCWGAIMTEKQKIIFLLDSGAHFSVLPFSPGPQSNEKSYHLGHIWPAPRLLVYLASGLLLGRPPLLSLFPHSTWNSNVPAGTGFTISIKSSNSPPPRQLSLLPPPSGTEIPQFGLMRWV